MRTTITRLYRTYGDAKGALQDLIENGVPREDIAIIANTPDDMHALSGDASQAAEGAGAGAGIGGVLGGGVGLLAGLGMIAIPGLGPVVAAGWLASTAAGFIAGAAAGAACGGVVGALMASGLSEEHATVYADGISKGGTLLTVRVDEMYADEIKGTLDAHGPLSAGLGEGDGQQTRETATSTQAQGAVPPEDVDQPEELDQPEDVDEHAYAPVDSRPPTPQEVRNRVSIDQPPLL